MGKHRKPDKARQTGATKLSAAKTSSAKPRHKTVDLLVAPRSDWHATDVPDIDIPTSLKSLPPELLESIHQHAKSLLAADAKLYADHHLQSSSSHKFMNTVMASGTWTDKVSAMTLVVQESPVHTQKQLENLLGLAGKRSRDQALMALGALKDMLAQGLMLPDRKLRIFSKQPGLLASFQGVKNTWTASQPLPNMLDPRHLVLWAYEDWLKTTYFELLKVLESWCNDEIEYTRMRAITFAWELLKEKPEQEENLLRLVVNKLGDNHRKIASRASHLLLQLQESHPAMKLVVINAIEAEVLLRPGQSSHAKYYAVITLNQTVLRTSDPLTASKLLEIYFSIFVGILNASKRHKISDSANGPKHAKQETKKRKRSGPSPAVGEEKAEQELQDKITAQVLTGINRAFPYSKGDGETFERHLNTIFQITHSSNFNTSIQALMLIQQISASHHIANITDRFMRTLYESLLDPRLLKSSKQTMYLNLLYRSLKSDSSINRVKAFVKRLLQILTLHEPPFIVAVLYLIYELQIVFPGIRTMLDQPGSLDDDGDEVFVDAPDPDQPTTNGDSVKTANGTHATSNNTPAYDGRKRDPLHANASLASLWEHGLFSHHYHPSAAVYANNLLSAKAASLADSATAKPDPANHTLVHFLDRFAYRNAKARPADNAPAMRGSSLMQPALASAGTTDTLLSSGPGADAPRVNTEAFWARKAADVAPDDVFFHRYFGEVGPRRKASKSKRTDTLDAADDSDSAKAKPRSKSKDAGSDDEWDDDVGAKEDEIWRALVGSAPDIEEGSDGFDDDDDVDADDDSVDIADEMGSEDDEEGGVDFDDVELNLSSDDEMADDDGAALDGSDAELNLDDETGSALFSSEDEAEAEPATAKEGAKKDDAAGGGRRKKRRFNDLPTFASAEDYAQMIDADDEGMDGA